MEVKLGSRRQKRVNHSQLLEQRKCEILENCSTFP